MPPSVPFSKVGRKQIHDMTDVSRAKTWCRNDCEHDYDNDFDSDCDYDHGCAHDDDVWLVMCLVNDM